MLIDEYYQRLVGYIVADASYDDTGEVYRDPQGTVFFVGVKIGAHGNVGYAVTCRHVIEGIARCTNPVNVAQS